MLSLRAASLALCKSVHYACARACSLSLSAAGGLKSFKTHAAAATQRDAALNRLAYDCVPKRTSEAEFWRCYFCWVHKILIENGMRAAPPRSAEEQAEARQAEKQAENIEKVMAAFDERYLAPARAKVEQLKQEYKQHLADSTDERVSLSGSASKASVQLARAYRMAIEEAQEKYENAREEMHEKMASLRDGQRVRPWAA